MPLPPACETSAAVSSDGLGALVFGLLRARGAAGDVDNGAGRAELDRDAAAGTAGGAGDQGDFAFQRHGSFTSALTDSPSPWEYINDHSVMQYINDRSVIKGGGMPRPKTLPDRDVLEAAYRLMHQQGPEALTFSALAQACGLSASTLVQRFKSKAGLVRSALSYAWDGLDEKTAASSAEVPKTPEGAVALLTMLSKDYSGIEAYAEGLLILREDFRDPALRARGAAWGEILCRAIDACFAGRPDVPKTIGMLMASQWQGCLTWWGFDPAGPIEKHVRRSLEEFVAAILGRRG